MAQARGFADAFCEWERHRDDPPWLWLNADGTLRKATPEEIGRPAALRAELAERVRMWGMEES